MPAETFPRHLRALLTETLPFEIPLIFTNEFRFNSLVSPPTDPKVAEALGFLRCTPRSRKQPYTVPHQYLIRKDRGGSTTLSLVHPESQIEIANFYGNYAETLLSACTLSDFSLRYPATLARIYSVKDLDRRATPKSEMVHVEPDPGETDVSRVVSFFSYRQVNLLAKFYDSSSYLQLEKRFSKLRTLDISRCFYNIYTHSITWAVKSKRFSKEHANCFAFEQQFDRLMQKINYNETNGIVVGPEISRIFAEIILQRIDLDLVDKVRRRRPDLELDRDFAVRRYVDDYFIYANDIETLDLIQGCLDGLWEHYKLYSNEAKSQTYDRPFVTPLSTAKRQIRRAIWDLKASVDDVRQTRDPKDFRRLSRTVKSKTLETRLIIGEHGVGFNNISTWCLSVVHSMIAELFSSLSKSSGADEERLNCYERSLWSLYSLVFYICSLDVRVSTTFSLGNLLTIKNTKGYKTLLDHSDWIDHVVERELIDLASRAHAAFFKRPGFKESVETLNLLILGAHFFGASFVNSSEIQKILAEVISREITYFNYVGTKFLLLKDPHSNAGHLASLNAKAIDAVIAHRKVLGTFAHPYFMLCDLLSSPDLTYDEKRLLWKRAMPGDISKATVAKLGKICGFVDWDGLRLSHSMRRRRLRPVYE